MTATIAATAFNPRTLVSDQLFDQLVRRLEQEHEIGPNYANRIMIQALAFLKACADNPGVFLAPPLEVDKGWHMFMLHSREYAEFCDRVAGRFLHHQPADGVADGGAAIQHTALIMRNAGLPVDEEMWSPRGTGCYNACHNDCNVA